MSVELPGEVWRVAHIAEGMLAERLGVSIDAAVYGLQRYVEVRGAPLHETARAIVEHGLLIDPAFCRPPPPGR
jgi:hypothetical protein